MEEPLRKPVRTDLMDVSPEMHRIEVALWKAMTPEQRFARMASMLDMMLHLAKGNTPPPR